MGVCEGGPGEEGVWGRVACGRYCAQAAVQRCAGLVDMSDAGAGGTAEHAAKRIQAPDCQ